MQVPDSSEFSLQQPYQKSQQHDKTADKAHPCVSPLPNQNPLNEHRRSQVMASSSDDSSRWKDSFCRAFSSQCRHLNVEDTQKSLSESFLIEKKALNERHPTEEMSALSNSPISSDASMSLWVDSFCRAFSSQCRRLNVVDTQKTHSESDSSANDEVIKTDALCQETFRLSIDDTQHSSRSGAPADLPGWETLPSKARPAFELICSYLRTAIFALVSSPFRTGVKIFMGREKNRPAVDNAYLTNAQRSVRGPFPILETKLISLEDPIIDQLANLLSSSIKDVFVGAHCAVPLSTTNLSLAEQILRNSSIEKLYINALDLDETSAPLIVSISSRAKSLIDLSLYNEPRLSYPATFINKLGSHPISSFTLSNDISSLFFGLPNNFWEDYFNEKLSDGSVKFVREGLNKKINKAPIDWTDTEIFLLEWERAE